MIEYVSGKMVEKNPTYIVVDVNGLAYTVNISMSTFSQIDDNENIKLFTHLQVREDSHTLFGFKEKSERELFKLLISVSGIGANTARTMLSSLQPKQIAEAIATEDVKVIQSAKGIGQKTAQRVILDLKDKILKVYDIDASSHIVFDKTKEEALSALEVLGFNKKTAEKVCDKLIKINSDITVEELIKQSLKQL